MTDLDNEEEAPHRSIIQHLRMVARVAMRYAPSAISICCAALAGYFAFIITTTKPPADISQLAVSILKSGEASPEMRAWAKDALGLPTGAPMTVGSIKSSPQ